MFDDRSDDSGPLEAVVAGQAQELALLKAQLQAAQNQIQAAQNEITVLKTTQGTYYTYESRVRLLILACSFSDPSS